jgi:hypothetical protein
VAVKLDLVYKVLIALLAGIFEFVCVAGIFVLPQTRFSEIANTTSLANE